MERARAALRPADRTRLTVVGGVLDAEDGRPRVAVIGRDGEPYTPRLRSWEHRL